MTADILFLGGTSIDLVEEKGRKLAFFASVGGSITNSGIIAAKLGLKTGLLSRIGRDPLGDFAHDFLGSCGLCVKGVIRDKRIHTPLAIARIDKCGAAKYTFYKNSPKESVVPIESVPKRLLDDCRFFHTGSSYSYQGETFEETLKFIKYLKKRKVFVSYDPNIRPDIITNKAIVKKRVFRLLKLADLAKLSETDLDYLTGTKDPRKSLKALRKTVKCELILTLGSKGATYLSPDGKFIKIPAFKVRVADTIGAGDAFTAGLIYKLIKQGKAEFFSNIRSNMIFASAVSALICSQKGANLGLKNIKQVKTFLAKQH